MKITQQLRRISIVNIIYLHTIYIYTQRNWRKTNIALKLLLTFIALIQSFAIYFRIYYKILKDPPRLLLLPKITSQKTEAISFHVSYQ